MSAAAGLHEKSAAGVGERRSFVNSWVDFLLLGGASLVLIPLAIWFSPGEAERIWVAEWSLLAAHVINNPHFAYSYELFYRNFRERAFGVAFPAHLRFRYQFAAIYAPLLLAAFLVITLLERNFRLLGVAGNLMLFMVGWHYVKQGYGMLIVDGVLKRCFFDGRGKRVLLVNAYAVWLASWAFINSWGSSKQIWGIAYYVIDIPRGVLAVLGGVAAVTTVASAAVLWRHRHVERFPWGGFVAYVCSLYVWLFISHPVALLIIPAMHSMQYLLVVFRYRINMERSTKTFSGILLPGRGAWSRLALFAVSGVLLGYLFFWGIPEWLEQHFPLHVQDGAALPYLFSFWMFINIHHYLQDSVMWRKDNPDTKRFLFGG